MRTEQNGVASIEAPYVGPRTYREGEHGFFFGRERESVELLSLLMARRLVLFYAQSGAGKSSLINASLIRDLNKRGVEVLPVARVISPEVPPDLEVQNVFAFSLMLVLDSSDIQPERFADMHLSDFLLGLTEVDGKFVYVAEEDEFVEALAAVASAGGDEGDDLDQIRPRVLIIDQLEEIFTTHLEFWEQREGFFQQLAQAMEEDPYLFVLLAMREDYVGRMSPYATILLGELRTRYYMQRMDEEAALEAIREPAKKVGRPFARGDGHSPDVAGELVKKLRQIRTEEEPDPGQKARFGEFVEPVQLQVVCYQLWDRLRDRSGTEITLDDLESVSGGLDQFVSSALRDFYQQSIAAVLADPGVAALAETDPLLAVSERKIRAWFENELITDSHTRSQVHRGEVTTGRAPNQLPNQAVRLLEEQFIVRSETRAGSTWYELVHDTFVEPILVSNRVWREERFKENPLARRAQEWRETLDGDPALAETLLYRDRQLADAWHEVDLRDVDPMVLAFLRASKEAQSQRAAKEARLEADRAREERDRQRRLKLCLGALAAMAIVATLFAAYFAIRATRALADLEETNRDLEAASKAMELAYSKVLEASIAKDSAIEDMEAAYAELQRKDDELEHERDVAAQARDVAEAAQDAAEKTLVQLRAENLRYNMLDLAEASLRSQSNSDLSLLLAVQAVRLSLDASQLPPAEVEDALQQSLFLARDRGPVPLGSVSAGAELSLEVHHDMVVGVAWSPDGAILTTASADGTAILWDAASGEVLRPLEGYEGDVFAVAFDPTGDRLATASLDGTVRLWDVASGETLGRLEGQGSGFCDVAWSPDGTTLAAGDEAGTFSLWDSASGEKLVTLSGPKVALLAIAFSPDGERLAAAWMDGSVWLWEADDLASEPLSLPGHESGIYDMAWSPDGAALATANEDGTAILWDVAEGEARRTLRGDEEGLFAVAFSPDGRRLATAGQTGSIRLWDAEAGELLLELCEHDDSVFRLAFSPDGRRLAATSLDGTARVLDLDEEVLARVLCRASYLDFSRSRLAVAREDGIVAVWDTRSGEMLREITATGRITMTDVAFHQGGSQLLTAATDGLLQAWNSGSGQAEPLPPLQIPVTLTQAVEAALSGDGSRLAAASGGGVLAVWDTTSGERAWSRRLWESPTGPKTDENDQLSTLSPEDSSQGVPPPGENPSDESSGGLQIQGLAVAEDGSILAVATESQSTGSQVRVWGIDGGEELRPQSLDGRVTALTINPRATQVAAASDNGELLVWDVEGDEIPLELAHSEAVVALAFSPSGQRLATATSNEIRIWEIADREGKSVLLPIEMAISDLAFSPSGSHLAAATSEGVVYLLPLRFDVLLAEACATVSRNLSQVEWETNQRAIEFPQICVQQPLHDTVILKLVRADQMEKARAYIERANQRARDAGYALELEPDEVLAGAFVEWARELTAEGEYEDAWDKLEQALQFDPVMGPERRSEMVQVSLEICRGGKGPAPDNLVSPACQLAAELASKMAVGDTISGTITSGTEDVWAFEGKAGQWLTIAMNKTSAGLDPYLNLLAPGGQSLVKDDDSGGDYNAWIRAYRLPWDGTYFLEARDYGEGKGRYALSICEIEPGRGILGEGRSVEGRVAGLTGAYWQVDDGDDVSAVVITATHSTNGMYLRLYGPDSELLQGLYLDESKEEHVLVSRVPASYTIIVLGADEDATGEFSLSLAQGEVSFLPQACGMTDDDVDYGPLDIGSLVILGAHRVVDGDANWDEDMAQYVGLVAQVTELAGVDPSGCPIVRVDVDGGEYFWRLRDLQLVE
jgi:WD40 repeat protein